MVLEKRAIQLPHWIKEVGVHTIKVKLKEGVLASFHFWCRRESIISLLLKQKQKQKRHQVPLVLSTEVKFRKRARARARARI